MTQHVYPTSALLGDYARAAAGVVPTTAILATASVGMITASVLCAFAVLFAVFGIKSALRHGTKVEATEATLRCSGLLPVSISWNQLDRMKLAYYSTRRDRGDGWMQLELRSGSSSLCIDSRIGGFTDLVEASARAAELRGLSLSSATSVNVQALGIKLRAVEPDFQEATGGVA
jgi:hypothetical protein